MNANQRTKVFIVGILAFIGFQTAALFIKYNTPQQQQPTQEYVAPVSGESKATDVELKNKDLAADEKMVVAFGIYKGLTNEELFRFLSIYQEMGEGEKRIVITHIMNEMDKAQPDINSNSIECYEEETRFGQVREYCY